MSIHNNNFLYLARFDGDPGQKTFLQKRGLFDPDFLLRVDEQSDQPIFYSRNVIRYKVPVSTDEYFFLNLFNGNTAAGRLVVVNSQRHFAPQDSALIQHLGKYLEAALSYAAFTGSGKNLRRDALLDYLSGKNHSDDKIMHLKNISPFSKLKNGQRLYCIVGRENSDLPEQYIAYQLEHALPESVCVLFDSHIVFLCANEYGQTPEELFRNIEELTQQYSITAGCSNPFTDFFDLKYCYQEAIFTLRFNGADDTSLLYHFRDCILEYFLHYGYSTLPIRLLCAECVIALMEHDKRNTTVSYCDSLRTYLDTGMNSAETARILNITRNTFLSRLERIMRFIDLDLENEDNKLYLQISLRLIKTQNFLSPSFD